MKKLLLSLGAIASVAAPVAAVVACGSTPDVKPATPGAFTLVSTKTVAELKAIKASQVQNASTALELNTLFGMKAGTTGFIFKGSEAKFDAATLTVKFTHNEGGTLVAQTWTVTPAAQKALTITEANGRIATLLAGISTKSLVKPLPEIAGKYGAMNIESDLQRKLVIVNTGFEVTFTNATSPAGHQTEILYFATNDKAAIQKELDRMNSGVKTTPLPVTASAAVEVTTETFTYTDATCQGADVVIQKSDLKSLGTPFDQVTEAALEAIIAKIA